MIDVPPKSGLLFQDGPDSIDEIRQQQVKFSEPDHEITRQSLTAQPREEIEKILELVPTPAVSQKIDYHDEIEDEKTFEAQTHSNQFMSEFKPSNIVLDEGIGSGFAADDKKVTLPVQKSPELSNHTLVFKPTNISDLEKVRKNDEEQKLSISVNSKRSNDPPFQ